MIFSRLPQSQQLEPPAGSASAGPVDEARDDDLTAALNDEIEALNREIRQLLQERRNLKQWRRKLKSEI